MKKILQVQWNRNRGKCGVCGDAYDSSFKRHEVGGPFATGFITETYSQGQQIDVMVQLTAAHLGKFIFRVCKQVDETKEVTQECLDQNQLKVRYLRCMNIKTMYNNIELLERLHLERMYRILLV